MKDIPGYEGKYAITDDGQVYSFLSSKFLKPRQDNKGYLKVDLYNNGEQKTYKIHQLVALAYNLPNPENKTSIDHKDRNKLNNHISNLRWATQSEQNYNKNPSEANKQLCLQNAKKVSKPVEQRDKNNHKILIATYPSSCAAAEALFGDTSKNSLINRCANGNKTSAYGYWWCFK